jgi:hypothetical protein
LNQAHQIDFIEKIKTPDLPPHILHFDESNPCMLLRHIDRLSGLKKDRRCWVVEAYQRVAVTRPTSGEELTLSRIPIGKRANGLKFAGWQVPFSLIFAGTVHRSQNMALHKAVIDFRTEFWEHDRLYVALSKVRNPENLCVLLPESFDDISSTDSGESR